MSSQAQPSESTSVSAASSADTALRLPIPADRKGFFEASRFTPGLFQLSYAFDDGTRALRHTTGHVITMALYVLGAFLIRSGKAYDGTPVKSFGEVLGNRLDLEDSALSVPQKKIQEMFFGVYDRVYPLQTPSAQAGTTTVRHVSRGLLPIMIALDHCSSGVIADLKIKMSGWGRMTVSYVELPNGSTITDCAVRMFIALHEKLSAGQTEEEIEKNLEKNPGDQLLFRGDGFLQDLKEELGQAGLRLEDLIMGRKIKDMSATALASTSGDSSSDMVTPFA